MTTKPTPTETKPTADEVLQRFLDDIKRHVSMPPQDYRLSGFAETALPKCEKALRYVLEECWLIDENWERIARILEGTGE